MTKSMTSLLPASTGQYRIINLPRHNLGEGLTLDKCAYKGCPFPRRQGAIYCIDHAGLDLSSKTHDDMPALSE
jgi:hypothetical protein